MIAGNDNRLAIGVDLGGTKVEIALVDAAGRITERARRATSLDRDPEVIFGEIVTCISDELLQRSGADVIGAGVGVAGQVDIETGLVRYAPNLRWRDYPLGERLHAALSMPVKVLNDVQAITYGEWVHGAGRQAQDLVCVFVGTGIGGGVIAGGRLVQGCSGNAGEVGHLTIDLDGPECSCGNRGCLEAFAGGWAIARRARKHVQAEPEAGARLLQLAAGKVEALTAEMVSEAYRSGDALARRLIQEVGRALGVGLATIANAFNPALLILGGGVLDGVPDLIGLAESEARRRALDAASRPLRIVKATLGRDAGAIGAAARVRALLTEPGPK